MGNNGRESVETLPSTTTLFKEAFKLYRNPSNYSNPKNRIFDSTIAESCGNDFEQINMVTANGYSKTISEKLTKLPGMKDPSDWKMFRFKFPEGLIFIENPFISAGQRYWIGKCLLDYPRNPNVTNIDNLKLRKCEKSSSQDINKNLEITDLLLSPDFYKKLRWVTFGYHHDWDTKIYSELARSDFPSDLAELTKFISLVLGFNEFEAQAAIVNYYHLDSTLSGHQDKSERFQEAPLFSISFGQTALFLIGGESKDIEPVPIYLRSGDIVVMTGKSRLAYHGVPRIIPTESRPWLPPLAEHKSCIVQENKSEEIEIPVCKKLKCDDTAQNNVEFTSKLEKWNEFLSHYISKCRINLNVRQVLFPGELRIPDEQ